MLSYVTEHSFISYLIISETAAASENASKPTTPVEGAADPQAELGLTDDVKVSACLLCSLQRYFHSNGSKFHPRVDLVRLIDPHKRRLYDGVFV